MHREASRSGVTPWPTRVGKAVVVAALFTRLMSGRGSVAIGALLALGLVMVVDYLASMVAIHRRPVTLSVNRTRVVAPDELQLTLDAPTGWGHLHMVVPRVNLFAHDSEFCTIRSTETSQTVVLPSAAWTRRDFVRFRTDLSIIGLVSARRWTTQLVPDLCLVPEGRDDDVDIAGQDDTGRIREYVPGDRMGMVAWGTTARTGQMHVRAAAPEVEELVVVVDLGRTASFLKDSVAVVQMVGRAQRFGESLLDQGRTFRLIAAELSPTLRQDIRELALASPRFLPRPDFDHRPGETNEWLYNGKPGCNIVSSTIYDRDELIRRLSALDLSAPIPRPSGAYIEVTPAGIRSVTP